MSIEDNKALVRTFWTAFSEMRYDDMFDMMADDLQWTVMGTTSISGTRSKEEFRAMIDGFGPLAPKGVRSMDATSAIELESEAVEEQGNGPSEDTNTKASKSYQDGHDNDRCL